MRILNVLLCGSWLETTAGLACALLPVVLSCNFVPIGLLEGPVLAEGLLLLLHIHALVSDVLLVIQLMDLRFNASS